MENIMGNYVYHTETLYERIGTLHSVYNVSGKKYFNDGNILYANVWIT